MRKNSNSLFLIISLVIGIIAFFAFSKILDNYIYGLILGLLFCIGSYVVETKRNKKRNGK